MLDVSDTEIVRSWLEKAFMRLTGSGRGPVELAAFCSVTPQAVNGWKKTGRITKSNLEKAEAFFGHGPRFTRPADILSEITSYSSWPFVRFTALEVQRLSPQQKNRLEALVRSRLDDWAEDAAAAQASAKSLAFERPDGLFAKTLSKGTLAERDALNQRLQPPNDATAKRGGKSTARSASGTQRKQ